MSSVRRGGLHFRRVGAVAMIRRDDPTPTTDASVVGGSPADLKTSVSAFFAAFPLEESGPPLERMPVGDFFATMFAATEEP